MLTTNYTYWFQRYLRRPLTPVESAIITRLERQRSHGGRIRIIIDDTHADLSRARRRSHIHTLHQQTIHGHTSYHLLHLPNKTTTQSTHKTTTTTPPTAPPNKSVI